MELCDFLLARIAEDERLARSEGAAAIPEGSEPWALDWGPGSDKDVSLEITPARVLAECQAKRRIVEWCSERNRVYIGHLGSDPSDLANYVPGDYTHQNDAPVLRLLALPYAEHPAYLEEWRP